MEFDPTKLTDQNQPTFFSIGWAAKLDQLKGKILQINLSGFFFVSYGSICIRPLSHLSKASHVNILHILPRTKLSLSSLENKQKKKKKYIEIMSHYLSTCVYFTYFVSSNFILFHYYLKLFQNSVW